MSELGGPSPAPGGEIEQTSKRYDVVVIGAGPNGLSAAIELARAGLAVCVYEARDTPGGGARTAELTLPGFHHDVCSTVHPLGVVSPFFRSLDLARFGLQWTHSPAPLAHVLGDGRCVTLERSIDLTAAQFSDHDARAYRDLLGPFVERFDALLPMILGPLRLPSSPLLLARFGLSAFRSMQGLGRSRFQNPAPRALIAGIAAHAMLPLDAIATASFGLVLACAGHAAGWPLAQGGSQAITQALCACLRALGGDLQLQREIRYMADLPAARAYVFDVTPRQLLRIAGDRFSPAYRKRLQRFRYGAGVFKIDWALSGPIPWRDPGCSRASTVHLSGSMDDIAAAEQAAHGGSVGSSPFILLVQPSLADAPRAPEGKHIAWAYCHVPSGSTQDATRAIESHIERFAPGFGELVLGRSTRTAVEMEQYNPNYVGGDINGGTSDIGQLFFRPMARIDPYATSASNIFLCSSSTPPGGGVHGMCGYWAARSVLARL
jgi:phytoene dehydrogenase-like protein